MDVIKDFYWELGGVYQKPIGVGLWITNHSTISCKLIDPEFAPQPR
jgi:hypothetical protein